MSKEIGFHFGALSETLEEQANEQGFTLDDYAEFCENVKMGLVAAHIHGFITDGEYNKILPRFMKYIVKNIKPLKCGESNERYNANK